MIGDDVNAREVWTPILDKVDKLLNTTWRDRWHILARKTSGD
jgi:hypothetical protein